MGSQLRKRAVFDPDVQTPWLRVGMEGRVGGDENAAGNGGDDVRDAM